MATESLEPAIADRATRSARILVVDDDEGVTSLLRRALAYEGYQVAVARDGEEGLRKALEWSPELVVLDILMPRLDGVEVCKRLRAGDPLLAILMLTAKDSTTDQVVGLDAGADEYVVKPFALEALSARIRALLRRREPADGEILRFLDLTLDTAGHLAARGEREIHLTRTEYLLLLQFMRHPRRIHEKEQLTERVWGYDFEGNYNVLEVYVRYLRTKLEAAGEPRLIHTVRGIGYTLREAAP